MQEEKKRLCRICGNEYIGEGNENEYANIVGNFHDNPELVNIGAI